MQALVERIRREGKNLGRGILKVDGFINHQLDPQLTQEMGREFVQRFTNQGVTEINKVITAEVSGIGPALMTALALNVPMIYARKKRPITMATVDGDVLRAQAPSHTKGGIVNLLVSPEYLGAGDRVLLIDDFLATGKTIYALAELIQSSNATLCGIGCVIEKEFERGREVLSPLGVPIITLAVIERMDGDEIVVRG